MPTVAGQVVETGCWIDGHWGQYANDRLAEIADSHFDWMPTSWQDDPRRIRKSAEDSEDQPKSTDLWELHHEAGDLILDWLNAKTDNDHTWVWHDGELYLWATDDLDSLFF